MVTLRFQTYIEGHPRWAEADAFGEHAYPPFMYHDTVADERFGRLYEMYPDWQQVAVEDDRAVGWFNAAPLPWTEDAALPDTGWDAALLAATDEPTDAAGGSAFGVQIVVAAEHQGRGLSRRLLERMRDVAEGHGARRLVVPVRPSWKARYPLIPMAEYAAWHDAADRTFDPWVRVHVAAGGRIVGPCERAMRIEGSVEDWEGWTGMRFPGSGRYIVDGALAPVVIDIAGDRGVYVEPNLWVEHEIDHTAP